VAIRLLADQHPTWNVYLALILSSSLSGKITRRYGESKDYAFLSAEIFVDYDYGLEWLTSQGI
jgi:hypothetical protein